MKWPERAGPRWLLFFFGSLLFLAGLEALLFIVKGRPPWETGLGLAGLSALAIAWTFLLFWKLARAALRFRWRPLAVAQTVLDEALRMKIALVFILLLLLLLIVLPFAMDPSAPLRYRVQTFLSFSLGTTGFLLSLMTIFLACGTLSGELQDKRIFTVLVKPIGRGTYLLGKWLGLLVLNTMLLAVSGLAVYAFTRYLAAQPAKDAQDLGAVRKEVLTARSSRRPRPLESFEKRVQADLDNLRRVQPEEVRKLGEKAVRKELLDKARKQWRSIGPHERQTYVFEGLQAVRRRGGFLQLRYKLMASRHVPGGEPRMRLRVNGREVPFAAKTGFFRVLPVSVRRIDEQGRLRLTFIYDAPPAPPTPPAALGARRSSAPTVTFAPGEGLEILYQVDGFGPNFARGLLILWIKLAFLAILGLGAATCLGFPVASLLSLSVFALAWMSNFLRESLGYFNAAQSEADISAWTRMTRGVLKALVNLLAKYGHFAPAQAIVNGRLVSWGEVGACLGWIGMLWCGLAGVVAWSILQRRELGRVQA